MDCMEKVVVSLSVDTQAIKAKLDALLALFDVLESALLPLEFPCMEITLKSAAPTTMPPAALLTPWRGLPSAAPKGQLNQDAAVVFSQGGKQGLHNLIYGLTGLSSIKGALLF